MLERSHQIISKDYLKNYAELQKIGLGDYVTGLEEQVHNLEQFFDEALELFNIQTADGLIEFVIARFLDKFIPEHLLFVIEGQIHSSPVIHYFRRLNSCELTDSITWYQELKEVFPQNDYPLILTGKEEWLSPAVVRALEEYETALILPMKGIEGIYGFVLVSNKVLGTSYTGSELSYLNRLIQFFSVGLQNTLHHQGSIMDFKTGLFNHAYFMRRLEEELFRSRRYKTETTLLLMDIDFFKHLNDTYGHLAGDAVLREIAKTMKTKLRVEDVLARFGGEEFTLLLPATPLDTAWEIAERLRKSIEQSQTPYEDNILTVTISLGCCISSPAVPLSPEELISRTDMALYKSKADGRNRTTVYSY